MAYKPNHTSMYLIYINGNETHLLPFFCDIFNEVFDYMQLPSDL